MLDHTLLTNVLPSPDTLFTTLLNEVSWQTMLHRGGPVPRLIAVQGALSESTTGAYPIYRHPADCLPPLHPFSDTVALIQDVVQERVAGAVFNHVLIQHYRGGADYISEHSDKTLDIMRGSAIVNVSLGAQRTMTLRPKKEFVAAASNEENGEPPAVERIALPHNSLFVLGMRSNMRYQHGIKHDNRPFGQKSVEEQAFGGERISLTFRCIATFLVPRSLSMGSPPLDVDGGEVGDSEERFLIYGQGAKSKEVEGAHVVPLPPNKLEEDEERKAVEEEVSAVIRAFGEENFRADSFDWEEWYGAGFDVVHFS
ncbi:hypothetical protein D9611_008844 [Ephemerocybe angulata]|uniref:Fe2OG dioxygenase domain-containing protein n=1 Tax=Ephemerocybe angulata TaxID=980116 RepID=A0A8H5C0Y2_9AGAR|nr:hypothetical protein D9611_008844 [Tulosesus angulatus]